MKVSGDDIKNNLTFLAILGVIGYILVVSGAYKDIQSGNYNRIFTDITEMFQFNATSSTVAGKTSTTSKSGVKMIVMDTPSFVLDLAKEDNEWGNIVSSSTKTVFYVMDDEKSGNQLKSYINSNFAGSYVDESMSQGVFESNLSNVDFGNGICNSLQECNDMRKRAYNHSQVTMFFETCAKGACIFNRNTKQYIKIRSKNPNDIVEVMQRYRNW
ncbi:MAG: hypothetical protein LKG27_04880 [Clostridiaceae bacterium]|nr:hypothetical protein [Clostridiaceae bacterium]